MNEAAYREAEGRFWGEYGVEPKEHFVELGTLGTTVRVQEVGTSEGAPVLFLHGSPTSGTTWAPLAGQLVDFRCLVPDLPPGGLSAPFAVTKENAAILLDHAVTDLLDALGVERAHLVASSSGSAFAFKAAVREPDRIGGVVHLGAPWLVDGTPVPGSEKLVLAPGMSKLLGALTPGRRMQVSMLKSIGHGPSIDAGRIPEAYWDWNHALYTETETFGDQMRLLPAFKGTGLAYAAELHVGPDQLAAQGPTLVVWGEHETMAGPEHAKSLVARMPDASLEMVAGAGHLPWLDFPSVVAGSVSAFLQRTS